MANSHFEGNVVFLDLDQNTGQELGMYDIGQVTELSDDTTAFLDRLTDPFNERFLYKVDNTATQIIHRNDNVYEIARIPEIRVLNIILDTKSTTEETF